MKTADKLPTKYGATRRSPTEWELKEKEQKTHKPEVGDSSSPSATTLTYFLYLPLFLDFFSV